jgi:hypothetical protein
MRHFSDALLEGFDEVCTLGTHDELKSLLPAYEQTVTKALKNSTAVEYAGKPKLEASGYILPDGTLINGPWEGHLDIQDAALFSLPEDISDKVYNVDYCDNPRYMDRMIENEASLLDYIYKNVIRVNSAAENSYISVDLTQKNLTSYQLNTLEKWLELVLYANKRIDLTLYSYPNNYYFNGILSVNNYEVRDIINLIKYVQTNKQPPSTAVWEELEN